MSSEERDVVIVGAGLAGLSCAAHLARHGVRALVLDASDRPGGRVRTDELDGFLLDRGFQVLLPAYPEVLELCDLEALRLGGFHPGALVRLEQGFTKMADPLRRPSDLPAALVSPLGSLLEKLAVLRLGGRLERLERELRDSGGPAPSSLAVLRAAGVGDTLLERFFRPFLGGIFLERELQTDARFLAFVWDVFSRCAASLPAEGMEALPRQLAERIPRADLRLSTPVERARPGEVTLGFGDRIRARDVVVATDGTSARRLLGLEDDLRWRGVRCLYYDAPESPVDGPWLVVNGSGGGSINNLCVPSEVVSTYAPAGRHLVSVTVLGLNGAVEPDVRAELRAWYGAAVDDWRHLRTYELEHALPVLPNPVPPAGLRGARRAPRLHVCGDHVTDPSIDGALRSGRRTALAILSARRRGG